MNSHKLTGRPVIFGEVLFDQFEDGSSVLGGAPFNVAWHLQGFGLNPLFISRVGTDAQGSRVVEAMESWGMDTRGVQRDEVHPTGTVQVKLKSGQPSFNIVPDQAYDYIDARECLPLVTGETCALLYYGTLISRGGQSRDTLVQLRAESQLPAFVDINLRSPWWDHTLIWQSLRNARWVKLNDDEIRLVSDDQDTKGKPITELARGLLDKFDFKLIIATLGSEGAHFITPAGSSMAQPKPVENLVDTVGAGDAFSSVTLFGLLNGWPLAEIQDRAIEFAAAICGIRGATTADTGLYERFLQKWQK